MYILIFESTLRPMTGIMMPIMWFVEEYDIIFSASKYSLSLYEASMADPRNI